MKHFDEEEDFHAKDRKKFRKERKLAQNLDRSKFKKTDQNESINVEKDLTNLLKGRVISISGAGSIVDCDNKQYLCSVKGFLKKEKTECKNLIAVGDIVYISPINDKEGSIFHIEPRYCLLSRTDISGKKQQLIAVNVDLAVICVSIKEPPLKPSLVDRYLIAAEKGNLHPIIVINKIDLLNSTTEEEKELYKEFVSTYEALGYPIISISTHTNVGLDNLKALLKDKLSVFSGQSGVGKSSLLNACFGLMLKTGELTLKTIKGAHTTTMAQLLTLPCGGYCVDTPGIRSFAIWKLQKSDVMNHFHDLKRARKKCKYPDCTHTQEPECAIIEAVEKNMISQLRYSSYLTLLQEAETGLDKTTWS